jgi:hypothetical protein
MTYQSGDVSNHDWEVKEAHWVSLNDAIAQLTFKSEQAIVQKTQAIVKELQDNKHLQIRFTRSSRYLMVSKEDLVDLHDQLIEVSRKALELKQYEVAYHSLQAALHCALEIKDEQLLLCIQLEADRQRAFVDAVSPDHRLSSLKAAERGGNNLYGILAQQAIVYRNQVRQEFRRHELEKLIEGFWSPKI